MMTTTEQILTVAVLAIGTSLTRFLPFLLFRGKQTPRYIQYLRTVLPPAVFAMLVVYCLKDVRWQTGSHGVPELLGIAITVALHLWRKNFMLSIFGGTIGYMILLRLIFIS